MQPLSWNKVVLAVILTLAVYGQGYVVIKGIKRPSNYSLAVTGLLLLVLDFVMLITIFTGR